MSKVSHYNSVYFLSHAHPRYMKCMFTNIQKQYGTPLFNSILLFKKNANFMDKTREFLVLRLRNFQSIVLSEPEHIGNFPNLHLCTFNIFLLNLGAVIEIFYFCFN